MRGAQRRSEPSEPARPRAPRAQLLAAALDWTKSIAIALGLFLFVRATFLEAFKIPTSSMEGTLLVGDFLLVNKAAYGARLPGFDTPIFSGEDPARGDVVVFHPPHDPDRHYVKRVVGVPGDTLRMVQKRLFVNGGAALEPYVVHGDDRRDAVHPGMAWQSNHLIASGRPRYRPTRDNWGPLVVPGDSYFVLGDNRDNSEDSRYWGFVHRDQIQGRPWFVYYSFDPSRAGEREGGAVRWARLGTVVR